MGLLKKLFNNGSQQKENWELKLTGIDYLEARNQIAYMFALFKDEAKQKGGEYVYKEELINVLEPFMNNPCFDTAVKLLEQFPLFLPAFKTKK